MKKKILTAALAVCMLATLVIGMSLAYFTDTKTAEHTFTVGSVSIELIESQLHRVNAGVANGATSTSPLWTPNQTMNGAAGTAVDTKWTGAYFTDDQIKADAANYAQYLAEAGKNMTPGTSVRKCPYVINTSTTNDAYVRVRVLIPAYLNDMLWEKSYWTSTAINNGQVIADLGTNEKGTSVTVDGEEYMQYSFTYVNALKPGEMTFWNCWGSIAIPASVTDLSNVENGTFDVLVQADAIQADGFANATAAFAAFDGE